MSKPLTYSYQPCDLVVGSSPTSATSYFSYLSELKISPLLQRQHIGRNLRFLSCHGSCQSVRIVRLSSNLKTIAYAQLFTTRSYQERVDDIYKQLERNPWCPLEIFELKIRKINMLNSRIKNLAADMGREEGKYNTL